MRSFHIPFDMHTEDKIIGGYLSLRQFAWLIGAGSLGFMLFSDVTSGKEINAFSIGIRVVICLIVAGFALVMAFASFNEIEADKYLFKKIAFMMRPKIIKYTDKKK